MVRSVLSAFAFATIIVGCTDKEPGPGAPGGVSGTGTEGTQGSCRTGYLCVDSDPGATTSLVCAPVGG